MNAKKFINDTVAWLAERRLMGLAILGVSVAMATVVVATGPEAEPQPRTEKSWPVSVVEARPQTLRPTLSAYGRIESRQMANLSTSVGAPVLRVLAPEGTWVEKGDTLVELDASELVLAVRRAESEYKRRVAALTAVRNDYESAKKMTVHHSELRDIAHAKLKRHQELYQARMISDAILDEVRQQASERAITLEQHLSRLANFPSLIDQNEAMVAEAKAFLDKYQLDLAQAEIRAPFAGRVIKTLIAAGDRVQPGATLLQVADYEGLELRASLPAQVGETLREKIDAGMEVTASGELDGRHIEFVLDRMSGDVKSGQSGIDAFFRPLGGVSLDIGRVLNIAVSMPEQDSVIALPIQSIYENNRIYRVQDDRLEAISVEQVGDHIDVAGEYRILVRSSMISPGDRLITTQLPRAITGLLVEPIDAQDLEGALAAERIQN